MAKKILFKGVEYPLQFNMLVFARWEEHTGLPMSDIGTLLASTGSMAAAVKAVAFLYFAIQDACEEQKVVFDYTLDGFIRGIDITDPNSLKKMFEQIDLGDGSEKKRQPRKPTKK